MFTWPTPSHSLLPVPVQSAYLSHSPSAGDRARLFARRAIGWIIAVEFLSRVALAFRSEACLYSRPAIDDAFYALICSFHLAAGHGLTADGIHPTNGVQPLIVFLHVPLFWIAHFDKVLTLRYVYVVSALIAAGRTYIVAAILQAMQRERNMKDREWWSSLPVVGAALSAVLYNLFLQDTNGLETGLYSLMLLATVRLYQHVRHSEKRGSWVQLGALCGVMILTRIDAVFYIGAIGLVRLLRRDRRALRDVMLFGLTAGIISAPWWLYNYFAFGSLMPISGKAQSIGMMLSVNLVQGLYQLCDLLSTFAYFPKRELPDWIEVSWCAFVFIMLAVAVRSRMLRESIRAYDWNPFVPFLIGSIGLMLYYLLTFHAYWFFNRYWEPVRTLWTIPVAIAITTVLSRMHQLWHAGRKFVPIGVSILLLGLCAFNVNRIATTYLPLDVAVQYEVGQWAIRHANETIGMEQSGIAGYMANNVVNLDGKVNEAALIAREHQAIGNYLKESNITYLIDWDMLLDPMMQNAAKYGVRYSPEGRIRSMAIYHRVPVLNVF